MYYSSSTISSLLGFTIYTLVAISERTLAAPPILQTRESGQTLIFQNFSDAVVGSAVSTIQSNGDVVWVASDDEAGFAAFEVTTGLQIATIDISGGLVDTNLGISDAAIGPCPLGNQCLFLADLGIGDGTRGAIRNIYRILEPSAIAGDTVVPAQDIDQISVQFNLPGVTINNLDTLFVDPITQDIHLIPTLAQTSNNRLFTVPGNTVSGAGLILQPDPNTNNVLLSNTFTRGDISKDGKLICLGTEQEAYVWERRNGETVPEAMAREPVLIFVKPLQGIFESLAFTPSFQILELANSAPQVELATLQTSAPTPSPTNNPTLSPSAQPTLSPTKLPTGSPSAQPTSSPSISPTRSPLPSQPTGSPTVQPTASPTLPTLSPTVSPTEAPPSAFEEFKTPIIAIGATFGVLTLMCFCTCCFGSSGRPPQGMQYPKDIEQGSVYGAAQAPPPPPPPHTFPMFQFPPSANLPPLIAKISAKMGWGNRQQQQQHHQHDHQMPYAHQEYGNYQQQQQQQVQYHGGQPQGFFQKMSTRLGFPSPQTGNPQYQMNPANNYDNSYEQGGGNGNGGYNGGNQYGGQQQHNYQNNPVSRFTQAAMAVSSRFRPPQQDRRDQEPRGGDRQQHQQRQQRNEPRRDDRRRDEPRRDEPRREEPRRDDKKEHQRRDQPRRDDRRRDEPRRDDRQGNQRRDQPRRDDRQGNQRRDQPRRDEREHHQTQKRDARNQQRQQQLQQQQTRVVPVFHATMKQNQQKKQQDDRDPKQSTRKPRFATQRPKMFGTPPSKPSKTDIPKNNKFSPRARFASVSTVSTSTSVSTAGSRKGKQQQQQRQRPNQAPAPPGFKAEPKKPALPSGLKNQLEAKKSKLGGLYKPTPDRKPTPPASPSFIFDTGRRQTQANQTKTSPRMMAPRSKPLSPSSPKPQSRQRELWEKGGNEKGLTRGRGGKGFDLDRFRK